VWFTFKEGEASFSHFFSSKIQDVIQALTEDKLEDPNHDFAQAGDKVTINRLTTKLYLHPIWSRIAIIVIWPLNEH
jgi:hypothetical protein